MRIKEKHLNLRFVIELNLFFKNAVECSSAAVCLLSKMIRKINYIVFIHNAIDTILLYFNQETFKLFCSLGNNVFIEI
jgi:hypothetical protein